MGRQIIFYMDQDAESAFVEQALTEGQILCESQDANTNPMVITNASELVSCSSESGLYLYQPVFGELIMEILPAGRIYINATKSPVIEFSRTSTNNESKTISRGRLWVEMRYWNDDGNLMEKSKELEQWYAILAKWVRKYLLKIDAYPSGFYWSASIRENVRQGYDLM